MGFFPVLSQLNAPNAITSLSVALAVIGGMVAPYAPRWSIVCGAACLVCDIFDGALARRLELPSTGWIRRYRVRVHGEVQQAQLDQLARGIEIGGVRYGAVQATLDRRQGDNVWLTMSLTEGKNREIRKICGHFGWPVSRLIRVAYGPFQLGSHLNPGDIEEVPAKVLREQLGGGKGHKVSGQLKLKKTPSSAPQRGEPRKVRQGIDKPRGERRHKPKRHAD